MLSDLERALDHLKSVIKAEENDNNVIKYSMKTFPKKKRTYKSMTKEQM